MAKPAFLPSVPEVAREAIIVMAGAFVAAVIVRGLPAELRRWFSWPSSEE